MHTNHTLMLKILHNYEISTYSLINTAYWLFSLPNTTITNNIRDGRHTRRSHDLNFEPRKIAKSFMKLTLKYTLSKASSKTKMKKWLTWHLKEHAATLLRHFIERYMDDSQDVLRKTGVITENSRATRIIRIPGFVCEICCDYDDNICLR